MHHRTVRWWMNTIREVRCVKELQRRLIKMITKVHLIASYIVGENVTMLVSTLNKGNVILFFHACIVYTAYIREASEMTHVQLYMRKCKGFAILC